MNWYDAILLNENDTMWKEPFFLFRKKSSMTQIVLSIICGKSIFVIAGEFLSTLEYETKIHCGIGIDKLWKFIAYNKNTTFLDILLFETEK